MVSFVIIIGLILVIVCVAGEVVLLMLVGVVKLVFSLFVDGEFFFIYFECKFMYLGFYIYDIGF